MVGIARACPLYTKLADTLSPITHDSALALKNAGVGAVGRYLEDLSVAERDGLFAVGLDILLLSEAPSGPLSKEVGHARAASLLQHLKVLGAPRGVHVMIDLEAQHGDHASVIAYDNALASDLEVAGYIPMAYVGAGQLLSGLELYALPSVHAYWRGGSLGVPEPNCGFAIWQIPPLNQHMVSGLLMDVSMTGADLRGRRPSLWCAD
jgi:hypothetical protein